jgi:hypothetical protein
MWINPFLEDLGPAPAWWLEFLAPERVINNSHVRVTTTPSAYGRAALRRELARLSQATEGTRNDSLNKAAFALGQLVGIGGLDEAETAIALVAEGQLLGLGLTETERTVTSGLCAGMEQPRGLSIDQ